MSLLRINCLWEGGSFVIVVIRGLVSLCAGNDVVRAGEVTGEGKQSLINSRISLKIWESRLDANK